MADIPKQELNSVYPTPAPIIVDPKGNGYSVIAPNNIIQSVSAAREIYANYRRDNIARIDLFSQIYGLISGNPPYDQDELDAAGLSHIANFNNMEASSIYEEGGLAYWNLLNQAATIAKFCFYDTKNPDLVKYAQVLADTWDIVVREWDSFEAEWCTLTAQLLMYGYSPAVWADEKDWRWKTIEISRFLLPDQASVRPSMMTTVFIETSYTVQQLYEIYQNLEDVEPGEKSTTPWNKEELGRYLLFKGQYYFGKNSNNDANTLSDMMQFQDAITNGDISFGTMYTDEVRLISMLQREHDGEISHYIFTNDVVADGVIKNEGPNGFLFFIDRQYKTIEEALVIVTASPGAFTIHANRGLGHKIFSTCQATMQMDCDVVNMSRLSAIPIIQSSSVGASNMEAIQVKPGVPMNIGNATFQNNTMGSNIEGVVGASGYLSNKLRSNIAHSGDDPGIPDRNQGSLAPSQSRAKSFKEFGVLKNNIAHFYKKVDVIISNMVIKMMKAKENDPGYKEAKRWKDMCISLGVPKMLFDMREGIPKWFRVKATRVAGDGSLLADIMGLDSLAPYVSSFGAKGVRQFQEDMVRATRGVDYVAAYLGDTQPDEVSGGASVAGIENNDMRDGKSPIFSADNEQRAHIKVHLELGKMIVDQRSQQQISAREADVVFTVLIPHLGEHIQAVAQNPLQRSFFEQVKEPFGQLSKYAALNRKNAEKEVQVELKKRKADEEATQATLNEEQRKDIKLEGDERRANAKVQGQNIRADEANKTRAQIMKEKVKEDAANNRLKVNLEAKNKGRAIQASKDVEELDTESLSSELSAMTGETISPSDIE